MRRLGLLSLCVLLLASCGAPRIDSSSDEALRRSTAKVRASLAPEKQTTFDASVAALSAEQTDLGGMTGEEVIQAAEFARAQRAMAAANERLKAQLREKKQAEGSAGDPGAASRPATKGPAAEALDYLAREVPEVAWVEIERNEAFVGLRSRPADLGAVMAAAALNANRATQFGFHVWAVDTRVASQGWRPGQPGLVCEVTARHGKIESNSCR